MHQQQEVRAYGLLLQDLVSRISASQQEGDADTFLQQQQKTLQDIVHSILTAKAASDRVTFKEIADLLRECCQLAVVA